MPSPPPPSAASPSSSSSSSPRPRQRRWRPPAAPRSLAAAGASAAAVASSSSTTASSRARTHAASWQPIPLCRPCARWNASTASLAALVLAFAPPPLSSTTSSAVRSALTCTSTRTTAACAPRAATTHQRHSHLGSEATVHLMVIGSILVMVERLSFWRFFCLICVRVFLRPVSGGNKPSSTYAEANTIFLALHHAYRILHPNNEYVTHTYSLSSVHGWDRSGRTMSTRAFLADKFAPVWQAARTLIQDHTETHSHTTIKIFWQCTEHRRLWSDPMRWMARVLTHRTVDTAANVATASGRK